MRKFLIAALTAAAVLALAGIAYAENTYTVDGNTKPVTKGSAKKPKPVSLSFDYTVGDTNPLNRGVPVYQYNIGAEGLVTYPDAFPSCSGGTTGVNGPTLAAVTAKCKKAKMGEGVIKVLVGGAVQSADHGRPELRDQADPVEPQARQLRAVRQDRQEGGWPGHSPRRRPADAVDPRRLGDRFPRGGKCLTAQHKAILAPYKKVKIKGVTSDELRFTVPSDLLHPVQGLDATVRDVTSDIRKRTAKRKVAGKRRTVGFYNAVGCNGNTRSIQVTFVAEAAGGGPGPRTPVSRDDRKC